VPLQIGGEAGKKFPAAGVLHIAAMHGRLQMSHSGLLKNGVSLSDATREVSQMELQLGMPTRIRGFFARIWAVSKYLICLLQAIWKLRFHDA